MHIDNIFIFILGGLFLLFRLLAQRVASRKDQDQQQPSRPTTPPPRTNDSEEERMRRFMEALGQPPGAKPPPKVTPRPSIAPRAEGAPTGSEQRRGSLPRPIFNPLPPLTTAPPSEPTRRVALPQTITKPPIQRKMFRPRVAEAPRYEVTSGTPPPDAPPVITTPAAAYAAATSPAITAGTATGLTSLLASPERLREAIVIREILGPPRSLQPL